MIKNPCLARQINGNFLSPNTSFTSRAARFHHIDVRKRLYRAIQNHNEENPGFGRKVARGFPS